MTDDERRATEAALLLWELRSRTRLRAVLRATARHHARYVEDAADLARAAQGAAYDLRLATHREVLRTRREAAKAGAERARAELETLRHLEKMPRSPYRGPAPAVTAAEQRAQTIASNTARSFVEKVYARAGEAAARGRDVILEVGEALRSRVDTIAATETATAFSDGRERVFLEDAELLPHLIQQWSAVLDRGTCKTCWGLHGALAEIGRTFDGYRPGYVHPRCRCMALPVLRKNTMRVAA